MTQPSNTHTAGLEALFGDRDFVIAVEIETSRGLAMESGARHASELALDLAEDANVDILCFTDNPGGNPHITPETLGRTILEKGGVETVINLSCKDYNRNALESRLWSLNSMGFKNILALSGDYPVDGFEGQAAPVFDTDSVGLLEMMGKMNRGLSVTLPGRRKSETTLGSTDFHAGAAVNPFKLYEGEYLTQLYKMDMKLRTGAAWIVSQIGYDARKHHELVRYLRMTQEGVIPPLLGSIYVLSAPAARFFGRWGIPGVAVNSELVEIANGHGKTKDRGRGFFDEFAAKQIAILRGCGYKGAYLSGRLDLSRIRRILDLAGSFASHDWRDLASDVSFPQPEEFYLFEPGEKPGTASKQMNSRYLEERGKGASRLKRIFYPSIGYRVGRFGKRWFFDHQAPGFSLGRALYSSIEKSRIATKVAHAAEQVVKVPLYQCRDCGDCSLPEIAELCPESQCVKNQRNGPCGGTRAGKCEILDKDCIYLRAYNRLKVYGEEEGMLKRPVAIKDARLQGTSSWANTFAQRDHYRDDTE